MKMERKQFKLQSPLLIILVLLFAGISYGSKSNNDDTTNSLIASLSDWIPGGQENEQFSKLQDLYNEKYRDEGSYAADEFMLNTTSEIFSLHIQIYDKNNKMWRYYGKEGDQQVYLEYNGEEYKYDPKYDLADLQQDLKKQFSKKKTNIIEEETKFNMETKMIENLNDEIDPTENINKSNKGSKFIQIQKKYLVLQYLSIHELANVLPYLNKEMFEFTMKTNHYKDYLKQRLSSFLEKFPKDTTVPLLDEKRHNNDALKSSWSLTEIAEYRLMEFQNKFVYVVGIGGPTRVGKSFILSSMLERFTEKGGTVHFGTFVHRMTMESVTHGMDIALVEYQGKFILLIDCEGLDSLTKDMGPTLMVIMAMISQKMIYLNSKFDGYTIENLNNMITIRNRARAKCEDTNNITLDTLYFILNKYSSERKDNFLQEKLNTEEYFDIKKIIDGAFPKQKTFFVCTVKSSQKSKDQFAQDIDLIIENILLNMEPFTSYLHGRRLKIGVFVEYLKNILKKIQ